MTKFGMFIDIGQSAVASLGHAAFMDRSALGAQKLKKNASKTSGEIGT